MLYFSLSLSLVPTVGLLKSMTIFFTPIYQTEHNARYLITIQWLFAEWSRNGFSRDYRSSIARYCAHTHPHTRSFKSSLIQWVFSHQFPFILVVDNSFKKKSIIVEISSINKRRENRIMNHWCPLSTLKSYQHPAILVSFVFPPLFLLKVF